MMITSINILFNSKMIKKMERKVVREKEKIDLINFLNIKLERQNL